MASLLNTDNSTISKHPEHAKNSHPSRVLKHRPHNYRLSDKDHDRLIKSNAITKTKINIENAINTPGYAYRGMKGDPDFNFFEQLKVSRIPYYVGGLGLAAICLAGKSKNNLEAQKGTKQVFKRILTGVLMYYIGRELANATIDIPVKLARGIDLNMPYRKVTSLREGNPLNLPNNKKPSNQNVFESTEFTRWDLLYKYDSNKEINETFNKLAEKFGVKGKQNDVDSKLMPKIRELMIMSTAWKYMLSAPFVITGLGLAQQDAFKNIDVRSTFHNIIDLFRPSKNNLFALPKYKNLNMTDKLKHSFKAIKYKCAPLYTSIKTSICTPVKDAFKQLWMGTSLTSKVLGRGAIIASVGMAILANAMILSKTSLKNDNAKGGKQ